MQRRLPPIHTSASANAPIPSHAESSSSPFSPQNAQQASSGQLQPRARIASQQSSQSVSAAGLPTASQGGASSASSGGGQPSRLARASPSLSQTASPSTSGTPSGLSRLVLTQIFILLGTIHQEKDKAKRDSQAEQISDVNTASLLVNYLKLILLL
jgi:CCR4-NOT transcription complex subunit 1